ncbi:MAG: cation-efflux pump [Theionarchaea archaeon]|nr:cation-efflux pump [Theionarchaea archaeon]
MEPDTKNRAYYGYKEAIVSIVVNFALFLVKLAIGIHIKSIAVITDGFHSLSDIITSVVVIFGFRTAQKPPDKEHPFGHGRFEEIAALIISLLLILAGIEFFILSIERLYKPQVVKGNFFFFMVILLTFFIKEGLARYSTHLSHKIHSHALLADAWHHRSDALSSIPVAFGVLASSYGIYSIDSLSGIGVSLIIMYMGYKMAKSSVSSLLGEAPRTEFVDAVKGMAMVKGVTDVYDVFVHDYGTRKVVSLSIRVEPMGLEEAHSIADSIEQTLADQHNASAVVHIDGVTVDKSMKKKISDMVESHPEVVSCHAVDIGEKIDFHITVDKDMSLEEAHNLTHHLQEDVTKEFKKKVVIHVEPCIDNYREC